MSMNAKLLCRMRTGSTWAAHKVMTSALKLLTSAKLSAKGVKPSGNYFAANAFSSSIT